MTFCDQLGNISSTAILVWSKTNKDPFRLAINRTHKPNMMTTFPDIALIDTNGVCPHRVGFVCIPNSRECSPQILGDMDCAVIDFNRLDISRVAPYV